MLFIIFIYFFFIVWILTGISKIKINSNHNKSNNYNISVVIAVRNEEKNIDKLLDCLIVQEYNIEKYEIIIANDQSKDNTLNILKKYSEKIKNLKIVNITSTPGKWDSKIWALNEAIKYAKGEIILQTDGDCLPNRKWLQNVSQEFNNKSVGVVFSYTPLRGNGLLGKIIEQESLAQDAFSGMSLTKNLIFSCNGRSMGYRKKYFLDVNGFDKINFIKGGDDDLLFHKIIYYKKCIAKYLVNNESMVYSSAPRTLKELIFQRIRYASKGIQFYRLKFVSIELKILMPFLYITNFLTCISIIKFCWDPNILLVTFILIKIISDWIFINIFANIIKYKIDYIVLIMLSILHPFYIIILSSISPFMKISWKDS